MIVDIQPIGFVEELYPGWGIWEVEALFEDGVTRVGYCQGDGNMGWAPETWEPGEDDLG